MIRKLGYHWGSAAIMGIISCFFLLNEFLSFEFTASIGSPNVRFNKIFFDYVISANYMQNGLEGMREIHLKLCKALRDKFCDKLMKWKKLMNPNQMKWARKILQEGLIKKFTAN